MTDYCKTWVVVLFYKFLTKLLKWHKTTPQYCIVLNILYVIRLDFDTSSPVTLLPFLLFSGW